MAECWHCIDDYSADDFPNLQASGQTQKNGRLRERSRISSTTTGSVPNAIMRRRRLGICPDNKVLLLRPTTEKSLSQKTIFDGDDGDASRGENPSSHRRIELRTRKAKAKPLIAESELDSLSETDSIQEFTSTENVAGYTKSKLAAFQHSDSSRDDLFLQPLPSTPRKAGTQVKERELRRERRRSDSPSAQLLMEAIEAQARVLTEPATDPARAMEESNAVFVEEAGSSSHSLVSDVAREFSKYHTHGLEPSKSNYVSSETGQPTTPASSPHQTKPQVLSAPSKKLRRIPAIPHRPHMDNFWNRAFVDDWNDEHSPKKQLSLPPANRSLSKKQTSPNQKGQPSTANVAKAAKKAFLQSKHDLADQFFRELDARVTDNKLSQLASSTGGIRIDWNNKLNTTAGRANWRRETIKTKREEDEVMTSVQYKHYASIELADKVIDDENRLLNVIAHEFCHLANFMISGVTKNPHGKEFKSWAAKVSKEFGNRGVKVTTKHSYTIDFKYVWACSACGLEFKRHSKSINPERQRCGACKGQLSQMKPVPKGKPGKESEYQKFMKEQMKLIKQRDPGSPQKEIMRMVAMRWANKEKGECKASSSSSKSGSAGSGRDSKAEGIAKLLGELTLEDPT